MNRRGLGAWAAATGLLMAASSAATWLWVTGPAARASQVVPASMLNNPKFAQFVTVYRTIENHTIWQTSPSSLLSGAINGMVGTLHDQYSNYLTSSELQGLNQMLSPTFTGIGIEVSVAGPPLRVEAVFPGSPAAKAGIRAGDEIVAVNGQSVTAVPPVVAVARLRGRAGTTVAVTVSQGGVSRTVRIERATIQLPTVFSRMLPGRVGYMAIADFGNDTGSEAQSQFRQLVRQGARGILLDLRDNPGGDVSQALTVADLFVPPGPVVTLKYKNPLQDHTYDSTGPGTKLPVVVLVDGNTASAAEILAAAISERQGGTLVGTRTFGKGIVQEVISLPGNAALKLTVARYYTPNGHYIEHVGLKPAIVDAETPGVVPSSNPAADPQLARAISVLRQRIANGT